MGWFGVGEREDEDNSTMTRWYITLTCAGFWLDHVFALLKNLGPQRSVYVLKAVAVSMEGGEWGGGLLIFLLQYFSSTKGEV